MAVLAQENYEQLRAVQTIDLRADEILRARAELPKRVAAADAAVRAAKEALDATKKALEDGAREKKRIEIEIGTRQAQVKKLDEQQWQLKTNEAFAALGEEMKNAKAEIGRQEEKLLELAYAEDDGKKKLSEVAKALAEAEAAAKKAKETMAEEERSLSEQAARLAAERETAAAAVLSELMRRYDHLRRRIPDPIAREKDDTCQACHMSVPPQTRPRIRAGELMGCQGCARILH